MFFRHNQKESTNFCHIKNGMVRVQAVWVDREVIAKTDAILFIEKFDLTSETIEVSKYTDPNAIAGFAVPAAACWRGMTAWKKVTEMWFKNGRIPGSAFLAPNGATIWISNVDLRKFEKF